MKKKIKQITDWYVSKKKKKKMKRYHEPRIQNIETKKKNTPSQLTPPFPPAEK